MKLQAATLILLLLAGEVGAQENDPSKIEFGVDVYSFAMAKKHVERIKEIGLKYLVIHHIPAAVAVEDQKNKRAIVEANLKAYQEIIDFCAEHRLRFMVQNEAGNWGVPMYQWGQPATPTASSTLSEERKRGFAGDYKDDTWWSANGGAGEWIGISYSGPRPVDGVELTPRERGYGFPVKFAVEGSNDDKEWTLVHEASTPPGRRVTRAIAFSFNQDKKPKRFKSWRVRAIEVAADDEKQDRFQLAGVRFTWQGSALNDHAQGWYPELDHTRPQYMYTWDWYIPNGWKGPKAYYRWDIVDPYLSYLKKSPTFLGVLYDESAHMQLGNNPYVAGYRNRDGSKSLPYWASPEGRTLEECETAIHEEVARVAEMYAKRPACVFAGENVWPAFYHTYARGGMTLAPKMAYRQWAAVDFAIGIGAAKQYGTSFWGAPDFWSLNGTFGNHSVAEYECALKFAYWMGVDSLYTESLSCNENKEKEYRGFVDHRTGEITPHGEAMKKFIHEYIPANPRRHTFRNIRPEVAFIRMPDSQYNPHMTKLMGLKGPEATDQTRAWLTAWNYLTHGYLAKHSGGALTRGGPDADFTFFIPLKGVVVYDHLVKPEMLKDLKLIILAGVKPPEAIEAVKERVKAGAVCVTLKALSPVEGKGKIPDGEGCWVVSDDFKDAEAKKAIEGFLGAADEIRYRFPDKQLIFKMKGNDPNNVEVVWE